VLCESEGDETKLSSRDDLMFSVARCLVAEEKCRTVPVVPLFLYALRGKVAQLVQYGTFPLHNIGFLEGAHPIAAELAALAKRSP